MTENRNFELIQKEKEKLDRIVVLFKVNLNNYLSSKKIINIFNEPNTLIEKINGENYEFDKVFNEYQKIDFDILEKKDYKKDTFEDFWDFATNLTYNNSYNPFQKITAKILKQRKYYHLTQGKNKLENIEKFEKIINEKFHIKYINKKAGRRIQYSICQEISLKDKLLFHNKDIINILIFVVKRNNISEIKFAYKNNINFKEKINNVIYILKNSLEKYLSKKQKFIINNINIIEKKLQDIDLSKIQSLNDNYINFLKIFSQ